MVRAKATHGGMNLHPSLLPLHRGPDPIFWAYHADERVTGATVHEISDDFDAGAIYGQAEAELIDGEPGDQLEARLADDGADLLVDVIDRLETERFVTRAQDESRASYQSWPSRRDLEIHRYWTVQHTLNFVAGVIPLGYQPWVTSGRGSVQVSAAWKIDSNPTPLIESWPDGQSVLIAVTDGRVELKISD
jgi:methionyl-tRNA formyltransferase